MSMNQFPSAQPRGVLKLKRPMSVAIYDEYSDAARAVDYLADRQFPVENLAIVGTDLKSVEKVTGNMTWGKVLFAGFMQGAMWAGMFAIFLWILQPGLSLFTVFMIAILGFGAVGMLMAALQYRMRGGERDYTSTTAIIATHYEVLAEAEVADRARHLLSGGEPHQTRQREVTTSAGRPSGQEQHGHQVDLGSMPPPYGQQPSQAAASGQPDWGDHPQPQQPPDWSGFAPPAEPLQPTTPTQPESASAMPYGQYWDDDQAPGIGDVPERFRPRRADGPDSDAGEGGAPAEDAGGQSSSAVHGPGDDQRR